MSSTSRRPTIGLVVPGLDETGGVATVARFLKDAILVDGSYALRIVSLAMAKRDPSNWSLTRPSTWARGAAATERTWDGLPYVHVGAVFGELELQRFRPRGVLARAVADCDVLQVVSGIPAWANSVAGLGKPVSLQTATLARVERKTLPCEADYAARWRKLVAHAIAPMDRRGLRVVDAVQVENLWMLDYARRLNRGRQVDIRYAPPGIDTNRFLPVERRPTGPGGYLLCVGRLDDPRKNVSLAIEAYARLSAATRERYRLVLAGAAGPSDAVWERASELGVRARVSFVKAPSSAALLRLYQEASVFVLPSREEGLGLVLLEGMACGIPVVSTRCGGPEGILTDGSDGFLVPVDDANAMAERIERLCADSALNHEMGERGRARVESRYSHGATLRAYFETWEALFARSRSHR